MKSIHTYRFAIGLLSVVTLLAVGAAGDQERMTVQDVEKKNENVIVRRVAHIKGNDARLFIALDPLWSRPEFDSVPYRHPNDMAEIKKTYKRLMAAGIDEVIVWELSVGGGGMGAAVPFSKGYVVEGYGEPDYLEKLVMMQKTLQQINKHGLGDPSVRNSIKELILNNVNEDYFEEGMIEVMINKLREVDNGRKAL